MGMLSDAKHQEKPEPKKKHKHPAAAPQPSPAEQPEGSDAADSDEAGAGEQPDAESDGAEQDAVGDGAGAAAAPPQPEDQGGEGDQGGADADADSEDGQQPVQQGGAQGASPVADPAAPGAGEEGTPDPNADQDPNAQPPETPGEDSSAGPGSESNLQQVPMSPGLKEEYDQANQLLEQYLYKAGDDKLASGLVSGLSPDGPGKIKNAATLSLTVLTQVHQKLNLPPQIVLPFVKDVVAHIVDLGEQVKQIQYSDQECTAILGAAYEGAMRIFGVNKGQVKNLQHHIGRKTIMDQHQKYLAAHASAKPAVDALNTTQGPPGQQGEPQGPPAEAGPQTGAPVGATATPTAGAPQQQPPPQGGMLAQAAQATVDEGDQGNG